jgi:hypothetical protein
MRLRALAVSRGPICGIIIMPDAGRSLAPLQVAVGVSGGSQIPGHVLRAGIVADLGCVTIQVDWQNTFNTLRKDRMLAAVQQRCPTLLRMVAWANGRHSRLLLERAEAVVLSQSGVRQGDPLGPLLFALTLQGPLAMVAELNQAWPLAYAPFAKGGSGFPVQPSRPGTGRLLSFPGGSCTFQTPQIVLPLIYLGCSVIDAVAQSIVDSHESACPEGCVDENKRLLACAGLGIGVL